MNQIEKEEKLKTICNIIKEEKQHINIWGSISQAEENTKEGRIPLVVFRKNHSNTYAVIEFEKLLELLFKK